MRKRVVRCAATFKIHMDGIPWVSSYKYLGCVIAEFLNCSRMVEHQVKLVSQALGTWLQRCRESVGEVNGRSFLQLSSLWWNRCYCMERDFESGCNGSSSCCYMVAHCRSQPNSHYYPCMKNNQCIRCQCVKKGLPCVDCRPSTAMPSWCENSLSANEVPTATPASDP